MSIKVLLVDDHKIVREGFKALLEKQSDIEVVAEAADGCTAVKLAQELSPDVVVMDIAMPDLNGIEATKKIKELGLDIKVVALSIHSSDRFINEMFDAGATGYLLKNCAFQELTQAIRTVAESKTYLSREMEESGVGSNENGSEMPERSRSNALSPREKEVLQLLAEGKISKEIASHLHLSVRTVDAHRQHIMDKLNIHSIAELTRYAIQEGITFLDA